MDVSLETFIERSLFDGNLIHKWSLSVYYGNGSMKKSENKNAWEVYINEFDLVLYS